MSRSICIVAIAALAPLAVLAACDDAVDIPSGSFELPDTGAATFDAPPTTTVDASDEAEVDAADAGEVDAADADAAVTPSFPGLIGNAGGARFDDRCPAGQLAIGLSAGPIPDAQFYTGALTQLRTLCGTLALPQGAATEVTIAPAGSVPSDTRRGSFVASAIVDLTCAANQIVVGLTGTGIPKFSRDFVASVTLRCAPLSYANGTFTVGTRTDGPSLGTATPRLHGPFDCAAGEAAAGSWVQSGEALDGVGPRCEPLNR